MPIQGRAGNLLAAKHPERKRICLPKDRFHGRQHGTSDTVAGARDTRLTCARSNWEGPPRRDTALRPRLWLAFRFRAASVRLATPVGSTTSSALGEELRPRILQLRRVGKHLPEAPAARTAVIEPEHVARDRAQRVRRARSCAVA